MPTKKIHQSSHVIESYLQGLVTAKVAAQLLNISTRTFFRRARAYQNQGQQGLVHGNTGRIPHNKLPDEVVDNIMTLLMTRYRDPSIGLQTLTTKLAEEGFHVSRETVRRLRHKAQERLDEITRPQAW